MTSRELNQRVFYICYNGIDEPLAQSQVLNYLRGLAGRGARIRLLTFEKAAPVGAVEKAEALARQGIAWSWERYSGRRGGLGTAWDVAVGARHVVRLRRADEIDFVHCRSYIPALMAWLAAWIAPGSYLYDIRGFWAHEKLYKGRIRNPLQFRVARWLEGRLYLDATAIVSLTHAGARIIRERLAAAPPRRKPSISIIPTCADLRPYAVARGRLDREAPLLVYSGSLGAGYLRDEVFQFFVRLRARMPGARLLVLSLTDRGFVIEGASRNGLMDEDFVLKSVKPAQVPAELMQCDVGLSFIKPDFSKIASCPTKLAEYLAAGLPVVANTGIGDVDETLTENRVGVVIASFDNPALDAAVEALIDCLADPGMIERARATAARIFSLDQGVAGYAAVYSTTDWRLSG
jgi:glycosyltransferase involved in cell wall biosynthesis